MYRCIALLSVAGIVACGSAEFQSGSADSEDSRALQNTGDSLGQGWSNEQKQAFYTTSTGSSLMPLVWFDALESPVGTEPLASKAYYAQFNAVTNPADPDGPPIGVVSTPTPTGTFVGVTCASCHTAELTYRGSRMLIDGAAGHVDFVSYVNSWFAALIANFTDSAKFDRFAARVLSPSAPEFAAQKEALRAQVAGFLQIMQAQPVYQVDSPEGFGRADAIGRAGNLIFTQLDPTNLAPIRSPLRIPSIWQTGQLDYTHYTGSVHQRFARGVANAVSLYAPVDFKPGPTQFVSGVRPDGLAAIDQVVDALQPPRWPEDVLGKINRVAAARGKALYASSCGRCHDGKLQDGQLVQTIVPLEQIKTDPAYVNLVERPVSMGPGTAKVDLMKGFEMVTDKLMEKLFAGLAPEQAEGFTEGRKNEWRAVRGYKARPLTGIWASAPYLHNGSVASLRELLTPASKRLSVFWTGGLEIDPVNVGIALGQPESRFKLDTTVVGNANTGHEYGVNLPAADKRALIEYLKTL